ncbi:alpha/beta hydrolase [Paenibacillus wulumuqiensis]|uniref:alpha/beta hydrolase n=1 Tax=Paenibacillus wulumuqiensis TaxID=1567107 RepID=UPI0006967D32|nr:alpha/beta hydrolase [Paenibacillus wulumuqiensis]
MEIGQRYQQLLATLRMSQQVEHEGNLTKIIKSVPDADTPGALDPRVRSTVERHAQDLTVLLPAEASKEAKESGEFGEPQMSPEEMSAFPIEEVRMAMARSSLDISREEIRISEENIEGRNGTITLRIYRPGLEQSLPAVLYLHSGAFIAGSLDESQHICKALAERAQAVVIAVDYRLAPEHPFPAGLMDSLDAVQWTYSQADIIGIDPDQIAIVGCSAGGNLAIGCSVLDRQQGTAFIGFQALLYPPLNPAGVTAEDFQWKLDDHGTEDKRQHDHRELTVGTIQSYAFLGGKIYDLYLQQGAKKTDPLVSPLLLEDVSQLPETLVVTAEFDYLNHEAEAMATKLARAGVKTTSIRYLGVDHSFVEKIGYYPQAEDCLVEIAQAIRQKWGRDGTEPV